MRRHQFILTDQRRVLAALGASFAFLLFGASSASGAKPPFPPTNPSASPPGVVPAVPRGAPQKPPSGGPLGVMLPSAGQAAPSAPPFPTAPLVYLGGPVLHQNTTYAIYWIPKGFKVDSSYVSTINGFFSNVAAASRSTTNVYSTDTQYFDSSGPADYISAFGGSTTDTAPFPSSGCSSSFGKVCLTDAQLRTEIQNVISTRHWAITSSSIFFIFTPQSVASCVNASCSFTDFCGYHDHFMVSGQAVLYADQPYAATKNGGCDPTGNHPNRTDADATINVVSHEQNETITDPLGTGWRELDGSGREDGDKCNFYPGPALGKTKWGSYNQVIGSGKYSIQLEWSNHDYTCVGSYGRTRDVFVSVGGGQVQRRTPTGSLSATLDTGLGGYTTGSGLGFGGNLYVTDFGAQNVSVFDLSNNLLGTFGSSYDFSDPESIVFDGGAEADVGLADGAGLILQFNPTGDLIGGSSLATEDRGTDWLAVAPDGCTLYYTSEGTTVKRYNVCTGEQLDDFVSSLPGTSAYAVVLLPQGGALVADSEAIVRLDSTGSVVQTYDTASDDLWFSLALDPSGTSFWAGDALSGDVAQFELNTGQVMTSFNTGGDAAGLTVR
jgi:hypothetical protein